MSHPEMDTPHSSKSPSLNAAAGYTAQHSTTWRSRRRVADHLGRVARGETCITSLDGDLIEDTKNATAASPACLTVFATPELADAIFIHLTMKDLLCGVQQVCRTWNTHTKKSEPLRELLFTKPITDRVLFLKPATDPAIADKKDIRRDHWSDESYPQVPRKIIQHPFLFILSDVESGNQVAIRRPEASWRHQLLTQPPVGKVRVSYDEEYSDVATISNAGQGVTMGNIAGQLPICAVTGWSLWEAYPWYDRLASMKASMRLGW